MATATLPARPETRPAGSPWILGAFQDFVLFVGTPLLILPLMLVAQAIWPASALNGFVLAFGALGHHLPGMMRAYGDRDLFRRFRVRFIVAPVFLLASCIWFSVYHSEALLLVVFAWGVWHGLMQTHGFLRIYDAKVGSTARATALLDHWMCLSWFAAAVVHSPTRTYFVLDLFYKVGGSEVPASLVSALRIGTSVLAGAVTLAYIVNAVLAARRGQPTSPVKHVLLVTSVAFFWYAYAVVPDLLIGVILFEIFHDVQYLSIVWLFNRRVVAQGGAADAFTKFVFRPRALLIVLYVGLVFAYGSLAYVGRAMPETTIKNVVAGALLASALLHFYYDGFIWKMREKATLAQLGIEGGRDAQVSARKLPPWAVHVAKWSLFVIPLVTLAALGTRSAQAQDKADRRVALGESCPDHATAQYNLGIALFERGDLEGAVAANRRALEARSGFEPKDREKFRKNLIATLVQLADARIAANDLPGATESLREAARHEPRLAELLEQDARAQAAGGNVESALRGIKAMLLLDPGAEARARAIFESLSGR